MAKIQLNKHIFEWNTVSCLFFLPKLAQMEILFFGHLCKSYRIMTLRYSVSIAIKHNIEGNNEGRATLGPEHDEEEYIKYVRHK